MRNLIAFLLILFCSHLVAEQKYFEDSDTVYVIGTLGECSGACGLCYRKKHQNFGHGGNVNVGLCLVPCLWPTLNAEYTGFLYSHSHPNKNSLYFTTGGGVMWGLPYVPIRFGIQNKKGFIDLGVKLYLGFFPYPEVRMGGSLYHKCKKIPYEQGVPRKSSCPNCRSAHAHSPL